MRMASMSKGVPVVPLHLREKAERLSFVLNSPTATFLMTWTSSSLGKELQDMKTCAPLRWGVVYAVEPLELSGALKFARVIFKPGHEYYVRVAAITRRTSCIPR